MNIVIDKSNPMPIYRQIEDFMRAQILSGQLRPHDLIPSENEISRSLDVSPMTVRQAIGKLVTDGLIYRERGRGTYVAAPARIDRPLTRLVGFSEDMIARGMNPGSQILEFTQIPVPSDVVDYLLVPEGTPVLFIKRLRTVDDRPVGIQEAYLVDVQITREELAQYGSMYQLLAQKGIRLEHGEDYIEAIAATDEICRLLGVNPCEPMLQVTRVTYNDASQPLEVVRVVYRSDFYRYHVSLQR